MVMDLLDKMMVPMRKVWAKVATRLRIRKTGLVKLRHDVRKCEYEDVHILWDMLKRNETGDSRPAAGRKRVRFWDIVDWAKRAPFICRSMEGTSSTPGMPMTWRKNEFTMTIKSRKLQGNRYEPSTDDEVDRGNINLEDYRPIDPAPSSKAKVRPGPIQHGTPLMPYIPKPAPSPPPSHEKHFGQP